MSALKLEDRLLIHELIGLYGHITDDRDPGTDADQLFADDIVFDLTALGGAVTSGLATIQQRWADPNRPQTVMHHLTNVVVTPESATEAGVAFKGVAVGGGGRAASVVYRGSVRRTDRGWRFARLTCAPMRLPKPPAGRAKESEQC